jgi:hypothetical protein
MAKDKAAQAKALRSWKHAKTELDRVGRADKRDGVKTESRRFLRANGAANRAYSNARSAGVPWWRF